MAWQAVPLVLPDSSAHHHLGMSFWRPPRPTATVGRCAWRSMSIRYRCITFLSFLFHHRSHLPLGREHIKLQCITSSFLSSWILERLDRVRCLVFHSSHASMAGRFFTALTLFASTLALPQQDSAADTFTFNTTDSNGKPQEDSEPASNAPGM